MEIEKLVVRENTTARISMTLYSDDSAIDLSAINHVEMHLRDSRSKAYRFSSADGSPKVTIVTASSGIVGFDPATGDLLADRSPYFGYWLVYPTVATKYSVPEENEFILEIRKEF